MYTQSSSQLIFAGEAPGAHNAPTETHRRDLSDQTSKLTAAAKQHPDQQIMTTTKSQLMLTAEKGTVSSGLRPYHYATSGFYKFLARFSGE